MSLLLQIIAIYIKENIGVPVINYGDVQNVWMVKQ